MTEEQLDRIKKAYSSGLKVQIWFNGYWKDFDIRDYSMYSEPFSKNRQYRIVGSDYADIAEKRIEELENKIDEIKANCDLAIEGRDVKIKELEKENAELRKNGFTVSAMTEQQLKVAIEKGEQLEKENAELKEKLNIRSCQNCKHNNKSCPNDGSCKHYSKWEDCENPQLTKARKFIKTLLRLWNDVMTEETVKALVAEAEQFLKEIEK